MKIHDIKAWIKTFVPSSVLDYLKMHERFQRLNYLWDFWTLLRPKLRRQLKFNTTMIQRVSGVKPWRVLLPLIETSHYQWYHLCALAKALELRGARVVVIVCGQSLDGCELKSIRNSDDKDPCWKCRFNELNILPLFGFEIVKIEDVFSKEEIVKYGIEAKCLVDNSSKKIVRHGIDLSQSIEDSVVRYFYGAVPTNDEQVGRVRVAHTKTALMSIDIASNFDKKWSPNAVLSNMPCYSAWEPYFRYFRANQDRFRQVSMSAFEFRSVVFNSFELFPAKARFEQYLKTRGSLLLKQEEIDSLHRFMQNRQSGYADLFSRDGYFSEKGGSENKLEKLNLDKSKRNIFLFSNLYWDVGLSDRKGLFDGVLDWVIQTIEILKDNPRCHLYIKPHPAEIFGSAGSLKGVSEIIRDSYPHGISNVTIIDPELKIVTYDLFPHIDAGVIFTGTLGLEMMLSGIPVISTGSTSHKGLGLASEPQTIDAYRDMLLGAFELPVVERETLELFAYYYFIRTLIPWTLTKQAYGNVFDGFAFDTFDDLLPGKNPYLDHLCNSIFDHDNTVPEAWPSKITT